MKNFIQKGKEITVQAPYDLKSGDVLIVGAIRGVAVVDAKESEEVTISTRGVFEIPKQGVEVLQGNVAYFDLTTKLATLAPEGEEEGDRPVIGVFVANASEDSPTARIKIG